MSYWSISNRVTLQLVNLDTRETLKGCLYTLFYSHPVASNALAGILTIPFITV